MFNLSKFYCADSYIRCCCGGGYGGGGGGGGAAAAAVTADAAAVAAALAVFCSKPDVRTDVAS